MNKIALWISVRADDWTAEVAIIAINGIHFLTPEFNNMGSGRWMMDDVDAGQNGGWIMGGVGDG